jgi:hypothetical protein
VIRNSPLFISNHAHINLGQSIPVFILQVLKYCYICKIPTHKCDGRFDVRKTDAVISTTLKTQTDPK